MNMGQMILVSRIFKSLVSFENRSHSKSFVSPQIIILLVEFTVIEVAAGDYPRDLNALAICAENAGQMLAITTSVDKVIEGERGKDKHLTEKIDNINKI